MSFPESSTEGSYYTTIWSAANKKSDDLFNLARSKEPLYYNGRTQELENPHGPPLCYTPKIDYTYCEGGIKGSGGETRQLYVRPKTVSCVQARHSLIGMLASNVLNDIQRSDLRELPYADTPTYVWQGSFGNFFKPDEALVSTGSLQHLVTEEPDLLYAVRESNVPKFQVCGFKKDQEYKGSIVLGAPWYVNACSAVADFQATFAKNTDSSSVQSDASSRDKG